MLQVYIVMLMLYANIFAVWIDLLFEDQTRKIQELVHIRKDISRCLYMH